MLRGSRCAYLFYVRAVELPPLMEVAIPSMPGFSKGLMTRQKHPKTTGPRRYIRHGVKHVKHSRVRYILKHPGEAIRTAYNTIQYHYC